MTPGSIRPGVPWDEYLALPGLSITRLKELGRSPQHYRHRLLHPKESAPLTFGRAAHCAVLEPDRYERDHAVWARRTASGRTRLIAASTALLNKPCISMTRSNFLL